MTESEWMGCNDLMRMLVFLRGEVEPAEKEPDHRLRFNTRDGILGEGEAKRATRRQLARFASECCAKWRELPLDEWSGRLIATYERFLSGDASWQDFLSSFSQLSDAAQAGARPLAYTKAWLWALTPFGMASLEQDVSWATCCHRHRNRIEELERTASEDELFAWGMFGYDFPEFQATSSAFRGMFPALLRETVGNPFHPVTLDLAWLTTTVTSLAHAIYAERSFERLPILADALEDSGCTNQDMLDHCRQSGEHGRGCWVVDLVLGKE